MPLLDFKESFDQIKMSLKSCTLELSNTLHRCFQSLFRATLHQSPFLDLLSVVWFKFHRLPFSEKHWKRAEGVCFKKLFFLMWNGCQAGHESQAYSKVMSLSLTNKLFALLMNTGHDSSILSNSNILSFLYSYQIHQ